MLRRFHVVTTNQLLTVSHVVTIFSFLHSSTSLKPRHRRTITQKPTDSFDDNDGFGGNSFSEDIHNNNTDEHSEFLLNFENDVLNDDHHGSSTFSSSVAPDNLPSIDLLRRHNEQNEIVQAKQILDESESSQAIAHIWPEILNLKTFSETSFLTNDAQFLHGSDNAHFSSIAVKISKDLVAPRVMTTATTTMTIAKTKPEQEPKSLLDVMKVEDVAFCFGVLQSVVEKSGTRLDEKFIADAAYRVFQADFDRRSSASSNENNTTESGLQVVIADEKSILATATATTFKSLVSSEFINDAYLNGIGLSKSIDLVEEMDISSIINLLIGLRKMDRTHFTFGEAEHHRKAAEMAGKLPTEKGQEQQVDILAKTGFTAMGRTSHRYEPKHYAGESPSLVDLLKEGSFEHNVIHPNLIDMTAHGIEKRIRQLIRGALLEMKELEKKLSENDTDRGRNHHQQGQQVLLETPATNSKLYKNKKEEDDMTLTISFDDDVGGNGEIDGDNQREHKILNQTTNYNNIQSKGSSNDSQRSNRVSAKSSLTACFIPICRSNELLQLISELCKIPSGVRDVQLWDDLSLYATKYFKWADSLTRINEITGRKEMMFETGQLLKLLPPLVDPIQALPNALDAIALAKKKKQGRFLEPTITTTTETGIIDTGNNNHQLIPTYDLLSLVSNTIAKNPRHVSIVGYRNPELMRNLRKAFEVYPVLYETSPALWDVVRLSRIPRRITGQNMNTGLAKNSGKLGQLPPFIRPIEPKRIVSREFMLPEKGFDPYWTPNGKQRGDMQAPSFRIDLKSAKRINKMKDKLKRDKFSKGSYHATRLNEAGHQKNME